LLVRRTVGLLLAVFGIAVPAAAAAPAADCQPFASKACLLPFPNNLFTKQVKSSPTGVLVNLPQGAMPADSNGVQISVKPYDRNDGFDPGSSIIVHVKGLDNPKAFAKTHAATLSNIGASLGQRQPIVLIDEATGKRVPIWSELDATVTGPNNINLMIHADQDLTNGHTYVVALRRLKNAKGGTIKAPSWFGKLRDGKRLPSNERSQQTRYDTIFAALKKAKIGRSNLYEAWDFTVMSTKDLTSRLLAIRNNAFAQLGDTDLADVKLAGHAPSFEVSSSDMLTPTLKRIQGTYQVPCYLVTCGASATTGFHYGSTNAFATPTQIHGNVATAEFDCIVPTTANPAARARVSLYGHGLLGSRDEVEDSWVQDLANNHNMAFCATDWWGLAEGDAGYDISALKDLNNFPNVIDRLQQGVLNFLFLGRLMISPSGFASNPAFQSGGQPVIDTSHLYYDGNSQGGIEGGLTTAVAPDFTHALLGVTGIDYGGLLLERSTDFPTYGTFLFSSYTDKSMDSVILDVMQQLWTRGDPDAYAAEMTSHPLPNTPKHVVLMQLAYGDFQVSQYSGAAEARTIGASVVEPALDSDRSRDKNLAYGIPAIKHYPFAGSAVEWWDSGAGRVLPPPFANLAPTSGSMNNDPHEDPRKTPLAQTQISDFLEPNGEVQNVCGGSPCHTSVFTQ
jgi:hypothetical protein